MSIDGDVPGPQIPAPSRCTRRLAMQRALAAVAAGVAGGALAAPALAQQPPTGVTKLISDVLDFALSSPRWRGRFGFVTFRLHAGLFNGERAYFIRTDASDQAFAREQGLVFAPKLALALESREPATADLYLFDHTAAAGQLPVLSSVPGLPDFSPAFRVHRVTWRTAARTLASAAQVRAAEQANEVRVERTTIVVNYPVVKWPGGELPADPDKEQYLGGGQLIEPVNTQAMTVTFKLHECYPASRYIVTDTSAVPMAPMMRVGAAAASQRLAGVRATAKIYVFGNGVRGSGPMGAQPSVFDSMAGQAAWSPFWDHLTVVWRNGAAVKVLKTEDEIQPVIQRGDLQLFNGVPETHPNGFVVNCPVPVLAPNDFVPRAADGRSLFDEPASIQALFQGTWGDRAAEQWQIEHDGELARRR
jgi:hypothetical protein